MARVKCGICDRYVDTTKGNYIFANGMHQHRKCPIDGRKLSDKEVKDKTELTDAIKWLTEKQGVHLSPAQWKKINAQIKRLKDEGYNYKDQLYAFKWYFDPDKNNEYKGYGIVAYIIEEALHEREAEIAQSVFGEQIGSEEEMKKIMEKKRKERLKQREQQKEL